MTADSVETGSGFCHQSTVKATVTLASFCHHCSVKATVTLFSPFRHCTVKANVTLASFLALNFSEYSSADRFHFGDIRIYMVYYYYYYYYYLHCRNKRFSQTNQ